MKEIGNKNLREAKCKPCEGGIAPFSPERIERYLKKIDNWSYDSKKPLIYKEFKFKDFIEAVNFVNDIAHIAEEEGHHPDIHLHYNRVLCELYTHSIKGISENDFIVASKIDETHEMFQNL